MIHSLLSALSKDLVFHTSKADFSASHPFQKVWLVALKGSNAASQPFQPPQAASGLSSSCPSHFLTPWRVKSVCCQSTPCLSTWSLTQFVESLSTAEDTTVWTKRECLDQPWLRDAGYHRLCVEALWVRRNPEIDSEAMNSVIPNELLNISEPPFSRVHKEGIKANDFRDSNKV